MQVFQVGPDEYRIVFDQESLEDAYYDDIVTPYILLSRSEEYIHPKDSMVHVLRITLGVRGKLNPRPEELFSIVSQNGRCIICNYASNGTSFCNECLNEN